jgi:hypothetical protein
MSGIPVLFAGSLKRLCSSEPQNFNLNSGIIEAVYFYITVDSLKKQ